MSVNGEQTLAEDIADLTGVTTSFMAYQASLHGKPGPTVNGFTADQQFFIAFGQNWSSKTRDAALRQQVLTDVHAPAKYRSYEVRNVDEWYEAFGVKSGEKLYLSPDQRVHVW